MLRSFLVNLKVERDKQQYTRLILVKDLRSSWLADERISRKKDVDAGKPAHGGAVIAISRCTRG
jgi:hypothetical protein